MIKEDVLFALESNKGKPVSGTALAKELGVSRNAIWKWINNLRENGYDIESTKKGYILSESNDQFSKSGILAEVKRENISLEFFDSIDSTNLYAMSMAERSVQPFSVVVANEQTAGMGRNGRKFYSTKDKGIYVSLLIRPFDDVSQNMKITTAACVGVARAIKEVANIETQIKWVNDIYLDGKKVGGILTRAVTDMETGKLSHIIVGIGVNCREMQFPKDIEDIATNIPGNFSRNQLCASIIDNVYNIMDEIVEKDFQEEYKSRSMILGKKILVHKNIQNNMNNGIPATAIDLSNNYGLIVEYENGQRETLISGEISIRLK